MALPSATFTEMVTTTLRDHRKELADNVSKNNALLAILTKKGNVEMADGGYEIAEPLDYQENSTYTRYSGYDTLNVQSSDVLTSAKYDWKQATVAVTCNGRELRSNSGKAAMIKLAKARLDNAMRSAKNGLSSDVYSDGTTANQINGLQALVSNAGTGTVGGIDSSAQTWWKSGVQSAASPIQGGGGITPSATTIQSLMLPLWLQLSRGTDMPDTIVSSNDYFTFYESSLVANQRYMDADEATGGFLTLRYKSAKVIFDGGSGIPTASMYFLNTDFLKLVVHSAANWTRVDDKSSVNQDAVVMPLIWQGNLVCRNRALQGIVKA